MAGKKVSLSFLNNSSRWMKDGISLFSLCILPFCLGFLNTCNRSSDRMFCLKQKRLPLVLLRHKRNQIIIHSCHEHVRGVKIDNIGWAFSHHFRALFLATGLNTAPWNVFSIYKKKRKIVTLSKGKSVRNTLTKIDQCCKNYLLCSLAVVSMQTCQALFRKWIL